MSFETILSPEIYICVNETSVDLKSWASRVSQFGWRQASQLRSLGNVLRVSIAALAWRPEGTLVQYRFYWVGGD